MASIFQWLVYSVAFPRQSPASFQWGSCSSPDFCDTVSYVYDEIVYWKWNLFQVPFGSSERLL